MMQTTAPAQIIELANPKLHLRKPLAPSTLSIVTNSDIARRQPPMFAPTRQREHCCHKITEKQPRRSSHGARRDSSRMSRLRQAFSSIPTTILLRILCFAYLLTPSQAVRIPFSNCLPDSYRFNDPTPLQFNPVFADAKFDTQNRRHTLQLVLWGNVTGSYNQGTLPGPKDPYWTNNNETNGKIVAEPDPQSDHPKLTTLKKEVDVLTYRAYSDLVDFCDGGLKNGSCPISPVFDFVDR